MSAHHGSETFYIEGEGIVGQQLGGRSSQAADAVTDSEDPTAPDPRPLAADEAPPFRFSRVGPKGTPLGPAVTKKLARAMIAGGGGTGDVPAGYTYLGQFVDHDLTMDRTKGVALGDDVTPAELVQGRSPRLDLDSLYGVGPANPGSARFYAADGLHLKVGDSKRAGSDAKKAGHDLPRVDGERTALIPDPRNDENLIVAQTHLAVIRFHNAVVDSLGSVPAAQRFREARKKVTLHYQWLIRHDYLPRIVDPAVLDDVFTNGRKLVEPDPAPTDVPTMPVEFSIAAFRLGHSMIRATYNWNRRFPGQAGGLEYMFDFSGLGGTLGGELRLLSNWLPDWRRMYDFAAAGRPDLAPPGNNVNRARRIDTLLTDPLKNLPPSTFGGPATMPFDDVRRNLAFRNLVRAKMVRLATGPQLAQKLNNKGAPVTPLTRQQILDGNGGAVLSALDAGQKDALVEKTPLWFYILREAELNNGRLAGVGARLVAETFHRAIQGSRFSIVRSPGFAPDLGRGMVFEMTDLLLVAFGNQESGLNPLGGA